MSFDLDPETARQVTETIGAHATRGGWITFHDRGGRSWSILVTPGIPIWLESDPAETVAPA
ncbi:MAG: hypothetical protein ACTHMS_18510 [Jatrophihabitans sp.]|uniref:hypothetical protein n=1 Tax=Jatrophihabitans sp. TaxID=1932789 RepID=UPI003F7D3F0C